MTLMPVFQLHEHNQGICLSSVEKNSMAHFLFILLPSHVVWQSTACLAPHTSCSYFKEGKHKEGFPSEVEEQGSYSPGAGTRTHFKNRGPCHTLTILLKCLPKILKNSCICMSANLTPFPCLIPQIRTNTKNNLL